MANCAICGRRVEAARVMHPRCWEKKAEELAEIFCNHYCRFPRECASEEELEEHCGLCHLIRLLNLGL